MNLAMILDMAADGCGDRIAVGGVDDGISFERLRRMASAPLGGVCSSGVIALAAPNGPVVPVTLFSALWAGRSYSPLNFRLPRQALGELVATLAPDRMVCAGSVGPVGTASVQGWLASRDAACGGEGFAEAPERPAALLFTSGTSAAPKAAELHHEHLLSYVLNTTEFASSDEDEAVLLAAPPFHIAGLVGVLTSCYAGRRLVPLESFSAASWIQTARKERVTRAFVVPTMLARIVSLMQSDAGARVPTLRTLTYGGARMPLPLLEKALRLFPEAGFVNAYGLTETSSTVSVLGPDDHREAAASEDPAVRRRLESAGRPIPGIEVMITDDSGKPVPEGELGEIRLAGAQVAGHYRNQSADAVEDGWLRTGDQGFVDSEGYIFVTGRADDMIIRGGENISPAEIENALMTHPEVESAAVVGLPDEEWGERVGAMVCAVPGADIDTAELRSWAKRRLGTLKTPELVMVRPELPVTDTGKVLRRHVRAELLGATGD